MGEPRSRFATGCFTEEKVKQLPRKTRKSDWFHYLVYHSAFGSCLAYGFNVFAVTLKCSLNFRIDQSFQQTLIVEFSYTDELIHPPPVVKVFREKKSPLDDNGQNWFTKNEMINNDAHGRGYTAMRQGFKE